MTKRKEARPPETSLLERLKAAGERGAEKRFPWRVQKPNPIPYQQEGYYAGHRDLHAITAELADKLDWIKCEATCEHAREAAAEALSKLEAYLAEGQGDVFQRFSDIANGRDE